MISLSRNRFAYASPSRMLFDEVRMWAYGERWRFDDAAEWEKAVYDYAVAVNEEFIKSLGPSSPPDKIRGVAQSIARWVWDTFDGERQQPQTPQP